MNKRAIIYVLGAVLLIGAALMLLPLLVALIYHEVSGWYFLWVMLGAAVLGALALRLGGGKRAVMYAKEGLIAVALSWIVLSLVGALPFTLSGQIPFYLDAVFETVSGFTAALACISNIGPGMGQIGPASCFNIFSAPVKMVLAVIMLLGRLELHPILAFFAPTTWRK